MWRAPICDLDSSPSSSAHHRRRDHAVILLVVTPEVLGVSLHGHDAAYYLTDENLDNDHDDSAVNTVDHRCERNP